MSDVETVALRARLVTGCVQTTRSSVTTAPTRARHWQRRSMPISPALRRC
jgi:heat shock protein HslJ